MPQKKKTRREWEHSQNRERYMNIEPEFIKCDCTEMNCPVFHKCCFLPTEINPDPDGGVSILFIGQGGDSDERVRGRPLIGRAGIRLRQQVLFIRKKLRKHVGVAFSNTIRDNPDGCRVPTPKEYEYCLKYLYRDIATLKKRGLKVIIPLGNASKDIFMPNSGAMSVCHGRITNFSDSAFGHISQMSTYHPSFVMRDAPKFEDTKLSEYDKIVLKDILKALDSIKEPKPDTHDDVDNIDITGVLS